MGKSQNTLVLATGMNGKAGGFFLGRYPAARCAVLHEETIEIRYQVNYPSANKNLYPLVNNPTRAIEEVKIPSDVRQPEPRSRPHLQREFSRRARLPVFASPHLGAADRFLPRVDLLNNV